MPIPDQDAAPESDSGFPIVGLGASAGGLAAFEEFFANMPAGTESGMAFVLVQHLAPDHKSILSELIKRYTQMQVCEVEDGMAVEPNRAYIIPPNRDMAFLNGKLHLLEQSAPRGQRLPIDFFFRSLAQDQRERAICIVLSGTGSDGTAGLRAIKGEGGMAMAQEPESTQYDGMPRSAIATGLVDFILPPAKMPAQLIAYAAHAFGKKFRRAAPPADKGEGSLKKIFILMRAQTGYDFSQYKQTTILRRVERRMAVNQLDKLDDYVRYFQQSPTEAQALFRDLLIGVTNFFRDPEAFDILEKDAIARLFAGKLAGAPVRVWVAGCSTGEEAYSIAILLQERMEALKANFGVQIFATDIDSEAIAQARAGVFPVNIAADIPAQRLARFFTLSPDGGAYHVQKSVRDLMVFSEHSVIKDPPFSRVDLISCRNMLIYMGRELQHKVIPLFHYALNPGGLLFLGNSESVGEFEDLFAPLNRKWKLYERKDGIQGALRPALAKFIHPLMEASPQWSLRKGQDETAVPLRELAERALLRQYAPASAVVNERGDVLFFHGRTGRYLEPAPGEATVNILQMAREGLRRELTTAIRKMAVQKEPVRYPGLRVKTNGDFTIVNLTVQPLPSILGKGAPPGLLLVTFEETPPAERDQGAAAGGAPAMNTDARVAALEQELRAKEEYLQTTLEEMETSGEELKSTNEEMQSVNEELQSTNEEMETSKEELQSVNEELATVNAELQTKVADLSQINNDMNNLMAGTGVGTIFVDHQLRIKRFTPAVTNAINLIIGDVGRPVGDIATNLVGYDRLTEDTQAALDSLIPREVEVKTQKGMWYLMRIMPYRTLENVIEGVVILFFDITALKLAKEGRRQSEERLREVALESEGFRRLAVVVGDSRDAIMVHDFEGRILAWNLGAERMLGYSEAEALAMNIRGVIPENHREEDMVMTRRLANSDLLEPFRSQRIAKDGHIIEVWQTSAALAHDAGEPYAIATTIRPVKE
jgi:two-component system CheB/CheR fusion protein